VTKLDSRNEPAYSITEASRYLRLSPATLRSWFLGRPYPTAKGLSQFAPVLKLAQRDAATLSFSSLIEAFVSTRSILDRIDAGEKVEDVARDYDITKAAVEEAVVFERAA
jgi:hypothetical protein